jgi:hypothetical protein
MRDATGEIDEGLWEYWRNASEEQFLIEVCER